MTNTFSPAGRVRFAGILLLVFTFTGLGLTSAADLKQARVTQVINDVKLLPQQAAPRPAVVNDSVRDGTSVRTGVDSRTELTFADLTIARLGANTIFNVDEGSRTVDLGGGAVLVRVPKNSGGAKISTAAVTAAITGTTMMAEYHKDTVFKFIMLEGTAQITRAGHPEEVVTLHGGEMLAGKPGDPLGKPVAVDAKRLVESSQLIQDFGPLGSEELMAEVFREQENAKSAGGFVSENVRLATNISGGTAILDALDQRTAALQTSSPSSSPTPEPSASPTPSPGTSPTPSPSPGSTPGKHGALVAITSANLSVIDAATTIQTDPSITRAGETGFGRIYRGPVNDATPSSYFFGGTNSFDTSSRFDSYFSDEEQLPIAAFKFQTLQINGDPTISTGNEGAVRLALISIGAITSGGTGAALSFAGIEQLLLATQNGSITLGSQLSFANLPALYVYARGANSNLTFDAAISGSRDLYLHAQNDLLVTNSLGVNQSANGQESGLNIDLRAGGRIAIGGNLNLSTEASDVQTGGNISVISGGDMTIGGDFQLQILADEDSTTGTGGNISVSSGGSLTAGDLNFALDFNDSVGVTSGVNLSLSVANDLTTTNGGIDLILYTPIGHTLTSGGNLTVNVGGNLNVGEGAEMNLTVINTVSTTVPAGANLLATVGGDFSGGDTTLLLDNSDQGGIGTGGNLRFSVGGNLTAANLSLTLDNSDFGNIGTSSGITLSTGGDLSVGTLTVLFNNRDGGNIDSNTGVNLEIGGTLTTDGDASVGFGLDNFGSGGGAAGGDVRVSLTSTNMAIGGSFAESISTDGGGEIAGKAILDLTTTNNISIGGNADLKIENSFSGSAPDSAGRIGSDALLTVSANNFAIGGTLNIHISSEQGGVIEGDALLTLALSGQLSAGTNASIFISNTPESGVPGSINGDAKIMVDAGSISNGGPFDATIYNIGAQIGGDAAVQVTTAGNLHSVGGLSFRILNTTEEVSAQIGGNATINVTAQSLTSDGDLLARLDNAGGIITGGASITINISGALSASGDANFLLLNNHDQHGNVGTIGDYHTIDVGAGSMTIGGSLNAAISVGATELDTGAASDVLIHTTGDITVGNSIDVTGTINAGGAISAGNDIVVRGGSLIAGGDITSTNGAVSINWDSESHGGNISSGGNISAATTISTVFGSVTADGMITAPNISADSVTAGGDINVAPSGDENSAPGLFVNTLTTPANLNLTDVEAVRPYSSFTITGSDVGNTPSDLHFSVASINTNGSIIPSLISNGADAFSQENGNRPDPGNGGNVQLDLSVGGLTIDSEGTFAGISANGGAFGAGTIGGNGGTVTINAAGDVNLADGNVTATTGLVADGDPPKGNGGTVDITSAGTISVSSTIEVSSNDPAPFSSPSPTPPRRRSATGGNIRLTSNRAGTPSARAVAIDISNSGQLLALLAAAPTPRPGGKIVVSASGANSDIQVAGRVQADGGTIDIRHTGASGNVALDGGTGNTLNMAADVIKVAALGDNGVLRVGGGTISADTVLQLYATGFNGEVRFISNVSLNGNSGKSIAGNSVRIDNGVLVTVGGPPADVYVNSTNGVPNANYTGSGGNGSTTGSFGGSGATNPQPLSNAPPLGTPPPVPRPGG